MADHVIEIRPDGSGSWTVRCDDAPEPITVHGDKEAAMRTARSIGAASPHTLLVVLGVDGTVEEQIAC